MKKKLNVFLLLSLFLLVTSGCWDNVELSEQAIVLGIGRDLTEKGDYQVSFQIAVPSALGSSQSGGGGQGKPFFVVTGSGPTLTAAHEDLQSKISRKINRRQRLSIYIGERLARHGIKDIMDLITRDSEAEIMSDISVVKGAEALDVLKIAYPLESFSSKATLNIHEQVHREEASRTFLDVLVANDSESMSPTMPVLKIEKEKETFQTAGSAIFDKNLELVGFLNENETKDKMWIEGTLLHQFTDVFIPQGNGKIGVRITNLKSKIKPMVDQNKVKFQVTLVGKGAVKENNTNFDLTKPDKVKIVEHELEKYMEKRVSKLIEKVQKEYGTDIFGFGDTVFRKDPYQWKNVKNEWEKNFQEANVSVKVDLTIRLIGMTGSPET